MPQSPHRSVLVTGDVTLECYRTRLERDTGAGPAAGWNSGREQREHWSAGGAARLTELIGAVTAGVGSAVSVSGPALPRNTDPADTGWPRLFIGLAPFPRDITEYRAEKVWRIEEIEGTDVPPSPVPPVVPSGAVSPDLIVIEDLALGFRHDPAQWPEALREPTGWVLLHTSAPVAEGRLWDHLLAAARDRLVVTVSADDLRRTGANISRGRSWERTALDLMWELSHRPGLNALSCAAHCVVMLDTVGALLMTPSPSGLGGPNEGRLFFDPDHIEGTWAVAFPGTVAGYGECLTAALAPQIILQPDWPDLAAGNQSGIRAARALHLQGYGPVSAHQPPAFPTHEVAVAAAEQDRVQDLGVVWVPDAERL